MNQTLSTQPEPALKVKHTLNPDKWIAKHSDYLYNYTIVKVNDRERARDIIQDTFVAALKSAKNYKGQASERTWLISILKRKIIDYYRRSNSKKGKAEVRMSYVNTEDSQGDWLEERIDDTNAMNIEAEIVNEELGLAIHDCLSRLPERQADIFRKRTIENQDTEAVCKEHDITPSNLWVILHRARVQLMNCLDQKWYNNY